MNKATTQLHELLRHRDIIAVPGVYDGVSARIAQTLGFSTVYVSRTSVSASRLGSSDVIALNLASMVEAVTHIRQIASLPIIVDGSFSNGNLANVIRAVRELEECGASAVILEDYEYPGGYANHHRRVIAANDMARRLQNARSGRDNPNLILIARTGSLPAHGFQELVDRIQSYEQAGAEMILVDMIINTAQMVRIREEATVPLIYDLSASVKVPLTSLEQVGALGFQMVLLDNHALLASAQAMSRQWGMLLETGSVEDFSDQQMQLSDLQELLRPSSREA
ncbi:MAG: isocitrate lyase/PEP mutase family protein [Anaerolinea sp.]|nr:isocitrate lyase/PEP mutase family protein [Anaerolinea sp.]MCC6974662.1 isocitrate lyase/PEP mutase family protein [Anaerolineae bacterium]